MRLGRQQVGTRRLHSLEIVADRADHLSCLRGGRQRLASQRAVDRQPYNCGHVKIFNSYARVVSPDVCDDWHGDAL